MYYWEKQICIPSTRYFVFYYLFCINTHTTHEQMLNIEWMRAA